MPKELIPEIEYYAFNLAIFLFVLQKQSMIIYSFKDFIELISIER